MDSFQMLKLLDFWNKVH